MDAEANFSAKPIGAALNQVRTLAIGSGRSSKNRSGEDCRRSIRRSKLKSAVADGAPHSWRKRIFFLVMLAF